MKLKISFKQINSNYSKEYADEYHFGKESVNNQKYHWSEMFSVKGDINKIAIEKNSNIHYIHNSSDNEYELFIENITILKCFKDGELFSQYGASSEFIEKMHKVYKEKEDTQYCSFYLKDNMEFVEVPNNLYVLKNSIKEIV